MPESNFNEIAAKYIKMNIAHPFMEGNGRNMRIWPDMMLKASLRRCVDWGKINKNDYLNAMKQALRTKQPSNPIYTPL